MQRNDIPLPQRARAVRGGLLLAPLLLLLLCAPAFAWRGAVESVRGCDGVILVQSGTGKRTFVTLYGVACPRPESEGKRAQPHAAEAAAMVNALLPRGAVVRVDDMKPDLLGRATGSIITLEDGTIVQDALLQAGLAWIYPRECWNCRRWKALQEKARSDRKGLWKEQDPVAPWDWGTSAP